MEATNLGCSKHSWRQVSKNLTTHRHVGMVRTRCKVGDHKDDWGRSVDESMIVLRLRIKKMKMLEANEEAPCDWMEWEKQYYAHYDQHISEAIGLLQSYLMDLRPSLALGMLLFVVLSVLICSGVGLFHALEIAKNLLYMLLRFKI
ncbi:hypothetical protein VNO77_21623 [Canavalia gladiata]|uniref:Uncharacterized protein n=1 Tax=Canavalia gladiata TaxID=3824 RepID=A0AAN9LRT9_CANGL